VDRQFREPNRVHLFLTTRPSIPQTGKGASPILDKPPFLK
jgi:hypothetical protein